MAEYLAPGVYVEEFDSGVKAMEGVGTSTAGFIGLAEKGPTAGTPVLITSFAEYQRRFGSYLSPQRYDNNRFLPNAVEHFFANGGSACYVMRVLPEGSNPATATQGRFTFTAKDHGEWGNRLSIVITAGSKGKSQVQAVDGETLTLNKTDSLRTGDTIILKGKKEGDSPLYAGIAQLNGNQVTLGAVPGKVDETCTAELSVLDVVVSHGSMTETYPGCTLNPDSPDYLITRLQLSQLVTVKLAEQAQEEGKQSGPLASLGGTGDSLTIRLSGGKDGPLPNPVTSLYTGSDATPGQRTGLAAFTELSDVNIMAIPGVTDQDVQAALIAHCETMGNRFAVLDTPKGNVDTASLAAFRDSYDSSYAAMYAPWIKVFDPLCNQAIFQPPSGAVCGIYARSDTQRGVHKAPANEVVRGCTGLSVSYNTAEQAKLNPIGVNLIRSIPGQGIRVWGARTCSSDGNWKYVNVRRLFLFLEESIRANTNWVVFEPNDESLWARVKGTITLFLETQRRNGALAGSTPDQAYYVNVGTTTMTQDDILNGRLICEIGVAPVRPAEFVVFRITQITQSTT